MCEDYYPRLLGVWTPVLVICGRNVRAVGIVISRCYVAGVYFRHWHADRIRNNAEEIKMNKRRNFFPRVARGGALQRTIQRALDRLK
jgi:hypothetical protein